MDINACPERIARHRELRSKEFRESTVFVALCSPITKKLLIILIYRFNRIDFPENISSSSLRANAYKCLQMPFGELQSKVQATKGNTFGGVLQKAGWEFTEIVSVKLFAHWNASR